MTGPRLLPYYIAQAIALGSLASVITLLGDIRDEFGLSETQIGLVVGAGFFSAFVTQLTLGRLADLGYAPIMVRIGLLAGAASMVGFAFSNTFWTFVLARAALGFAIGIAQPAIRRTVILADPDQTGRNLGRLGMTEVIGFASAPAIAAVLAEVSNLDTPFYAMAGATIVTLAAMGRPESDGRAPSADAPSSLRLLRDPVVAGTLLLVTSQFLMIGAWEAVWSVTLTDLGAETWEIGLSFTLFAIPLGALAPLAGARAQRSGGVAMAVGGLGVSGAIGVFFGIVDSVWGLIAVAVVLGIGAGIGFTAGLYAYAQTVPDDRQASAQGLMGAAEVLFGGVAAVLAAWIYDEWGRTTVWIVVPALLLFALFAGVALRASGSPQRQRDTERV